MQNSRSSSGLHPPGESKLNKQFALCDGTLLKSVYVFLVKTGHKTMFMCQESEFRDYFEKLVPDRYFAMSPTGLAA